MIKLNAKRVFILIFCLGLTSCLKRHSANPSKKNKINIKKENSRPAFEKSMQARIIEKFEPVIPSEHRIFISSKKYNGNLGGQEGANEKCTVLANLSGDPRSFKAILSSENLDTKNLLTDHGPVISYASPPEYIVVSSSIYGLLSNSFTGENLQYDENFNSVASSGNLVWSATVKGEYYNDYDLTAGETSCQNWTSADSNHLGYIASGSRDISGGCLNAEGNMIEGTMGVGEDICLNIMGGSSYLEEYSYTNKIILDEGPLNSIRCDTAHRLICISI